ncbi:hypothetical protein JMG10_22155 [Nostoc ellipsosporum NOK]|jgi:hypothetical protein|nr:hypothetical protein [Nostoc ellipsosporum NOK]
MKKIISLCVLALTLAGLNPVLAQKDWVKQTIDGTVSVKFPKSAEKIGEAKAYQYKGADSIHYTAALIDLGEMGLDSATVMNMAGTDMFFTQIQEGIKQEAPNVEMTTAEINNWKDYPAYYMAGTDENKTGVFMRVIFIGSKMFSLNVIVPEGQSTTSKDVFFNSFSNE